MCCQKTLPIDELDREKLRFSLDNFEDFLNEIVNASGFEGNRKMAISKTLEVEEAIRDKEGIEGFANAERECPGTLSEFRRRIKTKSGHCTLWYDKGPLMLHKLEIKSPPTKDLRLGSRKRTDQYISSIFGYKSDGYVYFISQEETSLVKIGWAKDPTMRLRELQVGNPYELTLIGYVKGSMVDEKEVHSKFSHVRGEWFRMTKESVIFMYAIIDGSVERRDVARRGMSDSELEAHFTELGMGVEWDKVKDS